MVYGFCVCGRWQWQAGTKQEPERSAVRPGCNNSGNPISAHAALPRWAASHHPWPAVHQIDRTAHVAPSSDKESNRPAPAGTTYPILFTAANAKAKAAAAGTGATAGVARARPCGHTGECRTMSLGSMKKRRRAATPPGGDGVDLISGLNDDLLLHILELLPDASDVVRTDALSRRWRGLWTGVAALRFKFCSSSLIEFPGTVVVGAAQRYVALVKDALALRAAGKESSGIKDLAISFDISDQRTFQLAPLSMEAIRGWIRYAAQPEVKSFVLKLDVPCRWLYPYPNPMVDDITERGEYNEPEYVMTLYQKDPPVMMTVDQTDSYAKMETMHLRLGGIELELPSSALFLSLADLSLEDIKLPAGGSDLLSRLVSSACCPRLHKLRLSSFKISRKEKLLIEAGALLELSLERIYGGEFLELTTPSLRVLHIVNCFQLKRLTPFTPRLEDLMVIVHRHLHIDDVHGHLSSVGTLKIQLFSHGIYSYDRNASSIHLLECCRFTRCLEVSFKVQTKYQTDDTIEGRIPPLPHVTSLSVCLTLLERHASGPGIACLLAQCNNIQYLSIQLCDLIISTKKKNELDLLCDYECHWKSHELSLTHLQEVEFKNLLGNNCEFRFIQSIVTGAPEIQKVTITFNRRYWRKGRKHAFKVMPPLQGGSWTTCNNASSSYKWRNEDLVYEWTRE